MKDPADISAEEHAYWEGRAEAVDELKQLRQQLAEQAERIGELEVERDEANAAYRQVLRAYHGACDESLQQINDLVQRCLGLEAENNRLQSRIGSLMQQLRRSVAAAFRFWDWRDDQLATLTTEVRTLREALEKMREGHQVTLDQYDTNGPHYTGQDGHEYYDASYVTESAREEIEKIDAALSQTSEVKT